MTIYKSRKAINRTPLNQADTLIPKPHVSFKISSKQKEHQPNIPSVIIFAKFVKLFSLKSVMAMVIRINSRASFGRDTGTGRYPSLFKNIRKKFNI